MKDLVVYFSLEGNTQYVAERIKEQTGADLLRLVPKKAYQDKGFAKFFWGGKSAVMAEKPALEEISIDLDMYDRIIFGFPVWASNYAPPLRTFIENYKDRLKDMEFAAYACQSGSGAEKAFIKLANTIGIDHIDHSEIFIDPKAKTNDDTEKQIERFCEWLKGEPQELLPEERLQEIVEEIQEGEPSSDIRYSLNVDGILLDLEQEKPSPSFHDTLLKLINEKKMTNVEFYKKAWIDRKLFSAIKNNANYKPKKETAIACCLGLQLSLSETDSLLETAGYSLSRSQNRDRVIRYCISHKIFKIEQVNQILYEVGEECLGC